MKKRRYELNLFQKDIAEKFGVSTECVTNWENNLSMPQVRYMPTIIAFLGYDPFKYEKRQNTLQEKIKSYRLKHGLSYKRFGQLLSVDGSTVSSWEQGINAPQKKLRNKLYSLIK